MSILTKEPELLALELRKRQLDTIQINLGNLCNQSCKHCHIEASPKGDKIMDYNTSVLVIRKLTEMPVKNIELTGGTPELNPNFKEFIEQLTEAGKKLTVRTSLTVLADKRYQHFIDLYREKGIGLVVSLPGLFPDIADSQRGRGVFKKSIETLKALNSLGYGNGELTIDIVYNPVKPDLPPEQTKLQETYKQVLKEKYGIHFNNLYCITNAPIGRFGRHLKKTGLYERYLNLLKTNYNSKNLETIMCRNQLSVDFRGYIYDCDFNLALDLKVQGYEGLKFWEIDFENFTPLITLSEHCYACTAGRGSSCHGEVEGKEEIREKVRLYYGETLSSSKDLKTSACCSNESLPPYVKDVLPYISDEVVQKFYGCGSPIPPALTGCVVLDLGCGTGRDVFIASKLVGEDGFVIGVDMTEEQLEVAKRNINIHMERFGYKKINVDFRKGFIEDLSAIGIDDNSVDVVISNCVINLSADKEAVFREIFRVLKPGGELYFSDVFSGRRIPEHLKDNPVLLGECLAGAMYIEDFRRLLTKLGYPDYRVVSKRPISLDNREIFEKIGMVDFYSMTIRVFKLDDLEDRCEDYGQVAIYKGSIDGFPHFFDLDDHHRFITGKPMLVCGNTASMLQNTRFFEHFNVYGDRSTHYGLFDCAPAAEKTPDDNNSCSGGACC